MDVIDRLIAAVHASGIKQIHIARLADMKSTKLNKILKRKQVPTVPEFIAICRAIDLDPARLFTDGELVIELKALREAHAAAARVQQILGNWLPEVEPQSTTVHPQPKKPRPTSVEPIRAAADSNVELLPEIESEKQKIPRRALNRGAQLIARAVGDSMDGGNDPIRDGELVYVKKTRSPRTANGHIVLCRAGEGIYLKKLERIGRKTRLVSANRAYAPIDIDETTSFEIYGIAVDHAMPV
jgi:SOS-response transcriptional repressor LexA